jgi:hypothetical protein
MKKIYGIAGTDNQIICHPRYTDPSYLEMEVTKAEHQKCQDNGDGTGTWVDDTDSLNEQARLEANRTEYADMAGKSLEEKLDWAKARMQETTLDNPTKVALGAIFKKLIAASSTR